MRCVGVMLVVSCACGGPPVFQRSANASATTNATPTATAPPTATTPPTATAPPTATSTATEQTTEYPGAREGAVEWLVDANQARGSRVVYVSRDPPERVTAFFERHATRVGVGQYEVHRSGGEPVVHVVQRISVQQRDGRAVIGDRGTAADLTRIIVVSWPDGKPVSDPRGP